MPSRRRSCGVGVVRPPAVRAQAAHQPLRDDADDVAGHDVRQDADVEQARDHADRRVGVQRRVHLVAGHGGAKRHFGGVGVADLADQDDVRVLAHHRAHAVGEVELGGFGHRGLADHGHRILDRILEGHDVDALGIDVVEYRVQRRGLAAAGRPGHQDDAFRTRDHQLEHVELVARARPSSSSGTRPFWRSRMRRTMFSPCIVGWAETRKSTEPPADVQRYASVLRRARLGDVHVAHHLDAHRHRRPVGLVQRADLAQHAVDAVADAQEVLLRLEVDVGGIALDRVGEQGVDQAHHRLAVFVGRGGQARGSRLRRSRSRAGCRRSTARGRSTGRWRGRFPIRRRARVSISMSSCSRARSLSSATMSLTSAMATVRRRCCASKSSGSRRWRLASSRGTSRSAAGSTIASREVDALLAQALRQRVAQRRLGDEAERDQQPADRLVRLGLFQQRDAQLVFADDALGDQDLAERAAVRLGREFRRLDLRSHGGLGYCCRSAMRAATCARSNAAGRASAATSACW